MRATAFAILLSVLLPASIHADAVDRMKMERLRATHKQVEVNRANLSPVELKSGYDDVRAILHAHSYLSHDSVETINDFCNQAADWQGRAGDEDHGNRLGPL